MSQGTKNKRIVIIFVFLVIAGFEVLLVLLSGHYGVHDIATDIILAIMIVILCYGMFSLGRSWE